MIHVLQQPRVFIQHFLFQRRDSCRLSVCEVKERVREIVIAFVHGGRNSITIAKLCAEESLGS